MAIPEHDKLVALSKRLRHQNKYGNWRAVRKIRREEGKITRKMRIREILRVEDMMAKSNLARILGLKYGDCMKHIYGGRYYRRYGKYDD